jgi:transcription elongation GreA/GreB family factor
VDSTISATDILDGLPFGVALFDADGTCVAVNSVLEDIASAGIALAGGRVDSVVASCFGVDCAMQARDDFEAVLRDGLPRASREWADRQGLRRFDCMWRRSILDGRPAAILGVVDVTAHCERREALEERTRLSASLSAIETTLSYTTDFDDILSVLAADGPDGFGCTSALTLCSTSDGWEVRHVRGMTRGLVGRLYETNLIPNAEESISHRRPIGGRITGAGPEWGDGEAVTVPLTASGEIIALLVLSGRPRVSSSIRSGAAVAVAAVTAASAVSFSTCRSRRRRTLTVLNSRAVARRTARASGWSTGRSSSSANTSRAVASFAGSMPVTRSSLRALRPTPRCAPPHPALRQGAGAHPPQRR